MTNTNITTKRITGYSYGLLEKGDILYFSKAKIGNRLYCRSQYGWQTCYQDIPIGIVTLTKKPVYIRTGNPSRVGIWKLTGIWEVPVKNKKELSNSLNCLNPPASPVFM